MRPPVVREIALWWQGELDRGAAAGRTPALPAHLEVIELFGCSEEEALRGVGLGEQRHYCGTDRGA